MTATERFIRDAQRGAFPIKPYGEEYVQAMYVKSLLLKPEVWQAVGKVRGWQYGVEILHRANDEIFTSYQDEWKYRMHGLIDALCDGKTIEQYLLSIETTV